MSQVHNVTKVPVHSIHWRFGCAGGWRRNSTISAEMHKAHGLEGRLEEPDWPRLTLPEVDRLLRRFPQAGGAEGLLSFSPRPFSAASVVATPKGNVFVKRHARSVRDRAGLMEEHRLIAHLAGAVGEEAWATADGVRVSSAAKPASLVRPVLADRDGETAVTVGNWTYEVHPLAAGVDLYEQALSWTPFLCVGHARAAGRALARLHRAARSYADPARKTQHLVSSFTIFAARELVVNGKVDKSGNGAMEGMKAYLDRRPLLRQYAEERSWRHSFDELLVPLYGKLEPWLAYLWPLWTHNDFHASNLTWSPAGNEDCAAGEVLGILDFGLADRTNAVHDLATAIERNIVEWLRVGEPGADLVHLDHLDALLDGYEELSPLGYDEARALAAMLPLVHCEFALSEADYFLSVLGSKEKAYLAYEGYFLAHAQWFQGHQGQKLLAHLERWSEDNARLRSGARPMSKSGSER